MEKLSSHFPFHKQSKPLPSVRTNLLGMFLACFIPGLVGGALMLQREYQNGRTELQVATQQTARAMVQAVDAQLAQGELLARALAASDTLLHRDFSAFHSSAQHLVQDTQFAQSAVIYDDHGQQIVNTRRPWNQPLPRRSNLGQIRGIFESGKPVNAEVLPSSWTQMPEVSIAAPIFAGTDVKYALVVCIAPDVFSSILARQGLPAEWVIAIFDNTGTIAARSHSPEKFVGQKAVPALRQFLLDSPEGSHEVVSLEGIQTVTVYSRSAQSGWSVAIGIPRLELEAQLRRSLLLLAAGAALLLAVSMALVWYFGGRIAASLIALRTSAMALGDGVLLNAPQMHLREAEEVAQAMAHASWVLGERAQALSLSHDALKKQEAELFDSQRIAKIGRWSWDKLTNVTWVSPEIYRMFGIQDIPPFAQQSGMMFPHEAWLELRQAGMVTASTGLGFNLELPALHADGSSIWVNSRGEAQHDSHGQLIGLHGMVQDITERKHQASELGAMRTEMQTMMEWQVARHTVAALAHEINQPLASMAMLCEAASRMVPTDARTERLEQTLQRLASETERAGAVVRQLVQSVSQPDIALNRIVLNELLHDVAKMVQDEETFDCLVHINCPSDLRPVSANYLQITKVLINLISNAAQAMQAARIAKGGIWIDAAYTADGSQVDVSVRDEGPGVDVKKTNVIFQPFITTKPDGLGMGLTISRAIVEAHGGKLWLEVPVGTGATFHFTLPISN